ncbi:MAG: manganese efflux pump MntP family protein [Clostridia bacterium]|nr:manganese efflux pump MntP family protein [Clostridia bacterium]
MDILSLLLVAVGLAMDAFSVALTSGMAINRLKLRNALKIGAFFGIFQAIMPCIGWALGLSLKRYIETFDHWVALILLAFIGGKMLYEGLKTEHGDSGEENYVKNPLDNKLLTVLAVATSIDALAVGITLATVNSNIITAALVIGTVTFFLSAVGVYIGRKCGNLFGSKAELIGGIVLIGIGIKILLEHLCE